MMEVLSGWIADPNDVALKIVWALIAFLPAMATNALPVLTKVLFKVRHPIDFNTNFIDGRRVLGDGKTWEGFALGLLGGSLVGLGYVYVSSNALWSLYAILTGLGALLGDLVNAFVKRRLGMREGAPFPPFDQVDYLMGSYIIIKLSKADSLLNVPLEPLSLLIAMAISLVLHPLTNFVAYLLRVKDVPW